MALREAIANSYDPCGLPHHKVVQVITRAIPGIQEATIRSHLHRLRKRGFVEKVCRKVGIEIVNDAQRVFCLDVRIDGAESGSALH